MENYETSVTQQWLTNNEQTYRMCMLHASACRDQALVCNQVSEGIWTVEQATRILLADHLKQLVEGGNPLRDYTTLYSDLLSAAMSEIDWHELADAFLEE